MSYSCKMYRGMQTQTVGYVLCDWRRWCRCVALLQKPEMSYFKMLGGLFSVNGFLNVILFPLLILVIRHKDRKYGMKLWFMILANIQLHLQLFHCNSTFCNLNQNAELSGRLYVMNEEGGAGEEPLLLRNGKPFFFYWLFQLKKQTVR